jgi:hypothetical protein
MGATAIIALVAVVWVLGIGGLVLLGRAAARGDRQMEHALSDREPPSSKAVSL